MNILLLGSGGRESALAWKIQQSPLCDNLFIAPGNPGTVQYGSNVNLAINDFKGISAFITANAIELLIIGPEDPLVNGLHDYLDALPEHNKLMIIGPKQKGAQLEGSKAFSKAFMQKYNIPTDDQLYFQINKH